MTVKLAFQILPLLLILFLQSGCTSALWTNGNLDAYKEPAPTPNVRLYESQKKNDFLVVYNEYSERHDSVRTRSYWLNKNERRTEDKRTPAFAREKSADHLPAIPVYYSKPNQSALTQNLFAVCDTNQDRLMLYSDNHEIGTYDLPVYKDHQGTVEKIALTPVTVTADAAMFGGCVGVLALYAWADCGGSFTIPSRK